MDAKRVRLGMKTGMLGLAIVQLLLTTSSERIAQAEKDSLTADQKVEDVAYLYKLMKENYPYIELSERITGLDWFSRQDYYAQRAAASEDDEAFLNILEQLLGRLGNGHTAMVSKEEYASALRLFLQLQDERGTHGPWVDQLQQPQVVERYQGAQSASEVERKKAEEPANSETSDKYRIASELLGRQLRARNPLKFETLEEGRVAYLKIPGLQSERKEADLKQILPFLEEQKDADALIFDIRGNGGGDSDYWFRIVQRLTNQPRSWTTYQLFRGGEFAKPFIESKMGISYAQLLPIDELKDEHLPSLPPETFTDFDRYSKDQAQITPYEPIGFEGRIYLLVDAGVFSSAEAWANFAKESDWATLVGERTGGDGIGWEGAYVALPNSGYVFRMELMMGLDATGASNFEARTLPDIEVDYTRRFAENGDACVLTALEEEKKY
ncbi:S41 family peptidase [Saccharibacillus sacchari]|uniref:S41 family peptidase n=1 Tax=Saccharibacillus sacchari TaxID=456493 RepID=UPI0012EB3374|nr:S41 family peptidase [Saccharibacillus sacchari]